jgi:hypothetical protein
MVNAVGFYSLAEDTFSGEGFARLMAVGGFLPSLIVFLLVAHQARWINIVIESRVSL